MRPGSPGTACAAGTTAIHCLRDRLDARVLVAGLMGAGPVLSYRVHYCVHRPVERPLARVPKRGPTNTFGQPGPAAR